MCIHRKFLAGFKRDFSQARKLDVEVFQTSFEVIRRVTFSVHEFPIHGEKFDVWGYEISFVDSFGNVSSPYLFVQAFSFLKIPKFWK